MLHRVPAFRAHLARTFRTWSFRAWCAGSPWWAAAIAVVADLVDRYPDLDRADRTSAAVGTAAC